MSSKGLESKFTVLLSKASINNRAFSPLKESDEDFANHSDSGQNQVRPMC